MMEEGNNRAAGITALNSGSIKDCYCVFRSAPGGMKRTFAAKNTGEIRTSFTNDRGSLTEKWNDGGTPVNKQFGSEKNAADSGFDTTHIWEYEGGKYVLSFYEATWYTTETIPAGRKPVLIKSLKELIKLSSLINDGDRRFADAYIKLASDIDCKGKKLVPIGESRASSFNGVFDGAGHTIKNFRIDGKSIGNYGLFGYLCGSVINLSLDSIVKGEGNVGALCGVNDGSIICCGVVATLSGRGDRLYLGGIAGQNHGSIRHSYAAVGVKRRIIPLLPIGAAAAVMVGLGVVAFIIIPKPDNIYATVITDSNQIKIEDDVGTPETEKEMNTVAFRFNETLHIDSNTGYCYLDFKNPSYDNNKVVVTLESKEEDGAEIMARSGAVDPGYGLNFITLTERGYELINSGVREGNIVVEGYNIRTNDKAMIDAKLPVKISIERGGD